MPSSNVDVARLVTLRAPRIAAIVTLIMMLLPAATVTAYNPLEIKCEACDYAIRSWARSAALLDLKCAGTWDGAGNSADSDFASILRADAVADGFFPDTVAVCDERERVSTLAVAHLGAKLCASFVDHYPHVKQAVNDTHVDAHHEVHESLFDDPPEYFDESPGDAIPELPDSHISVLRAACSTYLHLGSSTIRDVFAGVIWRAVEAAHLPLQENKIRTERAAALAALLSDEGEASVARYVKNAKRHAIYEIVLHAQQTLCFEACEGDVERPLRERRVRGWSATRRRL